MNEDTYWELRLNHETHHYQMAHHEQLNAEVMRQELIPVSMLKPVLSIDGNQYCYLLGSNLMEGVAGFGDTPFLAMIDFNKSMHAPLFKGVIK